MLIGGEHVEVGDEVLVRLRSNLNPNLFGSGWRIGTITETGTDIIADQPLFSLDDDGPPIYSDHVDFLSRLTRHEPNRSAWASVFDGL